MTTKQVRMQDHEHEQARWAAVRMEYGLYVEELPEVRAHRQRQAATAVPSEDPANAQLIVSRVLGWLRTAQQLATFAAATRAAKRHPGEQV